MPPSPRVLLPATAATCCAVALLAGCSNTQASINRRPHVGAATASVVGNVQKITVTTSDTYRFDPSTIYVHPGRVTVVLVNKGKGAPHNWTLTAVPGAATPLATAGQTEATSFTAPVPGSYTFVCTIHQRQGQTGKLVVLAK
jgi:plastocyanin